MKFKSDIEVQAGLKDSSGANGTSGQVLSSNGATVSWVNAGESVASDVQNEVKAGVAINKGQAVYVTGADGTNIIVGLASNTTEATSSKTLGLLNATVAINGFADVVQIGKLAGLDTSLATVGDPVWLGTNGNLIYGLANKPYAPAHLVFIGIVTRVNANNGEIFVTVQNGFELNEIHDVDLKTDVPINGDVLGYDGTLWVNKTIAEWLGFTPVTNARTITINGTTQDLSANRTWSVGTVTSVAALTLGTTGTDLSSTVANGTTTPVITLNVPTASATNRGALSSADWTTFNNKQSALTFTAPLVNTSGTVSITQATTSTNGYLSSTDWNTFNSKQALLNGTGFVKASGTTISYDNSTYVPTSRTLTINGVGYDLSADRSWTVTTPETDTLATVTARGNTTNLNIALGSNAAISGGGSARWITTDGTVNYGGGLISSLNGTAKAYYYYDGTNAVIQGAAGVGIAFQPDNATKATLNTSGDFTANNSLRSPIFYDSNNTGFYLDPSGSSVLNGTVVIKGNDNQLAIDGTTGGLASGLFFRESGVDKYELYHYSGEFRFYNYTTNQQEMSINNASGFVTARTSFRAPIFYDSNNTGYYVDPASTSNLNAVNFYSLYSNRSGASGNTIAIDNAGSSTWPFVFQTSAVGNDNSSGFWTSSLGYPDMRLRKDDGTVRALISSWERSYTTYGLSDDTDMRAPVFYDSNDTAYYVNPGDASRIRKTDIVAIGAGWNDALNIYSSDTTNKWNLLPDAGASNSLRFAYNGTERFRLQTNGVAISLVEHQSPIYYDFNNTAYYLNPDSTSNLNTVNASMFNGRITALNGTSTVVGQVQTTSTINMGIAANTYAYGISTNNAGGLDIMANQSGQPVRIWSGSINETPTKSADFNGTTVTFYGSTTSSEFYTGGWFRNNTANTGLYNQVNGNHIYSRGGTRWGVTGNSGSGNIYLDFLGNHEATYRGSIHADTSSNIGFLTNDQGWGLRIETNKNAHFHGNTVYIGADGQSSSNIIMRDGDEGDRQIHCNSNRIGFLTQAGAWGSYCVDNGDWVTDMISWSGASSRAPIFYDSNDTAYYGDFASTSKLNTLQVGTLDSAISWSNNTYMLGSPAHGFRFNDSVSSINAFIIDNSGNTFAYASSRAPIFYDSNNTGYYVDPASTTNIYHLSTNERIINRGGHGNSYIQNELPAGNNGLGTGIVTLRQWCSEPNVTWDGAGFGYNVANDGGSPNGFGRPNTNFGQAYMRMISSGNWYFYTTNTSGTRYTNMELTPNGNVYFSGVTESAASSRAPIFYDIADTGYYVDPNANSRISSIEVLGQIQGGSYIDCTNVTGGAYRIYNGTTFRGGFGTDAWASGGASTDIVAYSVGNLFLFSNSIKNGRLDTSGNFTVSGDVTAYGSPSDIRLKTIKEKIPNALESVLKLNGYRFDWKKPDEILNIKEDIGVIAQEVEAVFPELARTNENGFMSVRHQGLTAVLIEAIKEQQTQIEELKELVNKLINK